MVQQNAKSYTDMVFRRMKGSKMSDLIKREELLSQNIYDNPDFFDGYKKLRENPDSANILEEKPALFSLAPDLAGKAVLDLGCGYGENCAEFKRLGASRVVGIDISERMLEVSKKENTGIEFIRADMSNLSCIDGRFDVVFSSLAVHYIKDFNSFIAGVYGLLVDGGIFMFSQEDLPSKKFSSLSRRRK